MNYTTIDYSVHDGVLVITLDRPEHMNSFTPTMAVELIDAFNRAGSDDQIDAVVVTGKGQAFCAGMDLSAQGNVFGLNESMRPTPADLDDRFDDPAIVDGVRDTGGRVSLAIFECHKPVIGAVNGAAVGVGATMTLPMDIRIASEKARIGFVFGKLGIVPEACSTWFLPRLVGVSRALEWVYSAKILTAGQAHEGGLVSEVVASDKLLDRAIEIAQSFTAGRSRVATALTRQMMYRNSAFSDPSEAHRAESLAMFYTSIGDGREGVDAFKGKRPANYRAQVPADIPRIYR